MSMLTVDKIKAHQILCRSELDLITKQANIYVTESTLDVCLTSDSDKSNAFVSDIYSLSFLVVVWPYHS